MSNPNYIGYHFTVTPKEPGVEILLAELSDTPFESFEETESGISAFVQMKFWTEDILKDVPILQSKTFQVSFTTQDIEQVNWNEVWETNFEPIDVDGKCHIRAPFHPPTGVEFEIVIEPKMSFGTGHHETTFSMIKLLLEEDLKGKTVLDMGSGTAVLAILADKKGAVSIDAIDIDSWCYENGIENVQRNNCRQIQVLQGDASLLGTKKYDVIIANINRNILLEDISKYARNLNRNGQLFLSGFYQSDLKDIEVVCNENGLFLQGNLEKNNWIAAKFDLTS
ncbi:MAG: 50S ribosomal protein L11 methyltransferase [Flavobacteriaceae bacterium]|nr:50S ribosomal protein L11 methyltransferase [Flavobacteriaceae bacterium]MDZ4147401.1 50S ribosomal protein L11 methyltransferase [Flavobacteriaceae bacterium]